MISTVAYFLHISRVAGQPGSLGLQLRKSWWAVGDRQSKSRVVAALQVECEGLEEPAKLSVALRALAQAIDDAQAG